MNVTARLIAEYKKMRAATNGHVMGKNARYCMDAARTNIAYDEANIIGLARVSFVSDEEPYDDSYIDTWDLEDEAKEREKRKVQELIEREGVWGLVGEYRVTENEPWQTADSVWSLVGQDGWDDYENDVKAATLEGLRDAITARLHESREAMMETLAMFETKG